MKGQMSTVVAIVRTCTPPPPVTWSATRRPRVVAATASVAKATVMNYFGPVGTFRRPGRSLHESSELAANRSRQHQATCMPSRFFATSSEADTTIEEIQELYSNAKDEFEMAAEETEKKTVYAADDRVAAREEFQKLRDAYDKALQQSPPDVSSEIKNRVGQRIRELNNAMTALEEAAQED